MPWIRLPDGTTAHICVRGSRRPLKSCRVCGFLSSKLCDFKLPTGRLCNAPLCDACAVPVGPNLDHCPPPHHPAVATQTNLFAPLEESDAH